MKILTSVIGSYPPTDSNGRPITLEQAVQAQLDVGIDIVTDGQTTGDMIGIFAGKISGIELLEKNGRRQYEIAGELGRPADGIIVPDQRRAKTYLSRKKSQALLKGVVTGPYTLAKACENNYYGSESDAALALAEILNAELLEMQDIIDVVQIDEPSFYNGAPDYAENLFMELTKGVKKEIILHAHANKNHDLRAEVRKVAGLPVQVLSYDFTANPQIFNVLRGFQFNQAISLGCVRTDVSYLPDVDAVKQRIMQVCGHFGDKIKYVTPDCGLRLKTQDSANKIMRRLVQARDSVCRAQGF